MQWPMGCFIGDTRKVKAILSSGVSGEAQILGARTATRPTSFWAPMPPQMLAVDACRRG